MARLSEFTQIGVIIAAHGIRGEVKIKHFLDNPKSILSSTAIYNADGSKHYKIKVQSVSSDILIAAIDGVTDRNAAEALKGTELYVATSALPAAPDGSVYYRDLIGLEARLESGVKYGEIVTVQNFGAGDIIEIKKLDGSLEMLPFNNNFVGDVDTKKGFAVIFPPAYVEVDKNG